MAKYHLNPTTGNAGKCRAVQACPFGGAEDHYDTPQGARFAYERKMGSGLTREEVRVADAIAAYGEAPNNIHSRYYKLDTPLKEQAASKDEIRARYSDGLCYQLAIHLKASEPDRYIVEVLNFGYASTYVEEEDYFGMYADTSHMYVYDKESAHYVDANGRHESRDELIAAHEDLARLGQGHKLEPEFSTVEDGTDLADRGNDFGGFHDHWREDADYALARLELAKA